MLSCNPLKAVRNRSVRRAATERRSSSVSFRRQRNRQNRLKGVERPWYYCMRPCNKFIRRQPYVVFDTRSNGVEHLAYCMTPCKNRFQRRTLKLPGSRFIRQTMNYLFFFNNFRILILRASNSFLIFSLMDSVRAFPKEKEQEGFLKYKTWYINKSCIRVIEARKQFEIFS